MGILQVADRCDRCMAQAFVKVIGPEGELYFCAHHFYQHEEKLREFFPLIIDERDRIDA